AAVAQRTIRRLVPLRIEYMYSPSPYDTIRRPGERITSERLPRSNGTAPSGGVECRRPAWYGRAMDESFTPANSHAAVFVPHRITLASASPRRRELLHRIGVAHEVRPVDVDEQAISCAMVIAEGVPPEEAAGEVCLRRARLKAINGTRAEGTVGLLAADTVVAIDGEILDKPADEADAERMLRLLAGRQHLVHTAVVFIPAPLSRSGDAVPAASADTRAVGRGHEAHIEEISTSTVSFSTLSDGEIERYLASGQWRGVAGAYRIQGLAAAFVSRLEGSHSAVMGLPIQTVYSMITRFFGSES
ncbi:MAG: Maf family protein, partial [Spirochaetales bacterium]|nr:Maf family protein [Spirochaetales bacterium]